MLAWQDYGLFGDVLANRTVQLELQALHVRLAKAKKRQVLFFVFFLFNVHNFTLKLLKPGFKVASQQVNQT